MGIEVLCAGCGYPIGMNQQTHSINGYCINCAAQAQRAGVLQQPHNVVPMEKEVHGERLPNIPLIESKD